MDSIGLATLRAEVDADCAVLINAAATASQRVDRLG